MPTSLSYLLNHYYLYHQYIEIMLQLKYLFVYLQSVQSFQLMHLLLAKEHLLR
nr:MAG TPA: hypothetical protein [Caudoviricetes sp.]